jgi:uncharacterized protein YbgA (DUF1722 family)/uncharacterized protein YbbK (DUF523 family)
MMSKIKLGVSTCLLGEQVRYDGGHQLDRFIRDTLGQFVDYVPVCPEVECGLPVPREAMRLVGNIENPRLVTRKSGQDMTDMMLDWGRDKLDLLEKEDLCGFIFKSKSPSSGMAQVRVYNDKGMPQINGVGIWAKMFMERFPLLPVEEDGRLHDLKLREMFIERIFVFKRWREEAADKDKIADLIGFHTRHKLLIMSHSPDIYRKMGRLTANTDGIDLDKLKHEYIQLLTKAMALKTTTPKNTNVLQHLLGYFKKNLNPDEKSEFLDILDQYSKNLIPLIVPITIINHYVRKYDQKYLKEQVYLKPHPIELKLRNHA